MEPTPGIAGYDLIEVIGQGGFATVYRATQRSVGRDVAVKVLARGREGVLDIARFRREVEAVAALADHPHVVPLFDAGTTDGGAPFTVMQLVPGGSFGDRLRRSGPLSATEAARVGAEVADALSAAHAAGIVHRDVKPDNVLVGRRGRALLTDFGIATLTDATHTAAGTVLGTVAFNAPEVLAGARADTRSDVYCLAATVQTLVTGRPPFEVDDPTNLLALMWRVANSDPAPLPAGLDAGMASLIAAALAKEPAGRPSMAEMEAALQHAAAEGRAAPQPQEQAQETRRLDDQPRNVVDPVPSTVSYPAAFARQEEEAQSSPFDAPFDDVDFDVAPFDVGPVESPARQVFRTLGVALLAFLGVLLVFVVDIGLRRLPMWWHLVTVWGLPLLILAVAAVRRRAAPLAHGAAAVCLAVAVLVGGIVLVDPPADDRVETEDPDTEVPDSDLPDAEVPGTSVAPADGERGGNDGPSTSLVPAEFQIAILNSGPSVGVASELRAELQREGYAVVHTGNGQQLDRSAIWVREEALMGDAEAVMALIPGLPEGIDVEVGHPGDLVRPGEVSEVVHMWIALGGDYTG